MTRAPARIALAVAAALGLSACGFTPLYAEPGVVDALAGISVQAPDTRTGYLLREQLEDSFGRDLGETPAYRLTARVRERRNPLGSRADDTATRYELTLTVAYDLFDARGGRLLTDTLSVTTTYASSVQPYAGVVAQQDGEERAAAQAADLIRARLARFFAERNAGG
ncbi:LPS assembly lipoprotein LptE [Brevundimonas sp.]|uniref:LPS assembly lipoprotein LptE n=1 Tax=Brevundimonas sp. TaxID=1871086 RepID=UPI0025E12805|nr:LPS assembly lipoprotein LptE [Brevundimonas sp.]